MRRPEIDRPWGYTWHHVDDYDAATNTGTMQLIKTSAHRKSLPHSGGVWFQLSLDQVRRIVGGPRWRFGLRIHRHTGTEYWYISKLDSDDALEKYRAVEKLIQMRSRRSETKFRENLRSGDLLEKITAVDALGEIRSVESIPALLLMLRRRRGRVGTRREGGRSSGNRAFGTPFEH